MLSTSILIVEVNVQTGTYVLYIYMYLERNSKNFEGSKVVPQSWSALAVSREGLRNGRCNIEIDLYFL